MEEAAELPWGVSEGGQVPASVGVALDAFGVLHRAERRSQVIPTRVEQARNVRVFEGGQDAPLRIEALSEGRMDAAQACFRFLPERARLDLAGFEAEDIFAH